MNIKQQLELVKAERDKWKAVAEYRQKLIEKMEGDGQKYIKLIQPPLEVDRENPRIEVEIKEDELC